METVTFESYHPQNAITSGHPLPLGIDTFGAILVLWLGGSSRSFHLTCSTVMSHHTSQGLKAGSICANSEIEPIIPILIRIRPIWDIQ